MGLGDIADSVTRTIEGVGSSVQEAFFEPVVRLGVTGLSRSGKTVFITSLVANLLDRGRMPQLIGAAQGTVRAAYLQPQPDDTLPRFDYETHLAAMTGPDPEWPESTRSVSELRISFRMQPGGLIGAVSGPRTVHLDIVDYPGEWLLDLALLDIDYDTWSADVLSRIGPREVASDYLSLVETTDISAKLDEPTARKLAASFTGYLRAAREAGFYDCTPGRFLLPGDLDGSPVLTFAPLPAGPASRGSLRREMARRFEAYKSQVVKPFFRDHFARLDRQVVLVDALGALARGPRAVEDLRVAMGNILSAFRPGRNAFLTSLFIGKRVEKILFAATKADTLHHTQHGQLTALMEALLRDAKDRASFAGAETLAMSLAALRTTVEETHTQNGENYQMVRGRAQGRAGQVAAHPGDLPASPTELLKAARAGADDWNGARFEALRFLPSPVTLSPGDGPPHIRLDRAAEFLFGDRLR